jgi:hypothetical protein
MRLVGVTAAAVLLASWSTAGQSKPSAHKATECTMPALQQKAPPGTTITAAAVVAAEGSTPEYCRVDGPGPNTFDMLSALDAWVERGTAPSRVVASHASNRIVDRTRPLCPYPQVAKYLGRGSVDQAENFQCVAPGRATRVTP